MSAQILDLTGIARNANGEPMHNTEDKFVLVDTSSNGTYGKIGDLNVICARHDEIPLIGKGIICPGRKGSSSWPGAIHFTPR